MRCVTWLVWGEWYSTNLALLAYVQARFGRDCDADLRLCHDRRVARLRVRDPAAVAVAASGRGPGAGAGGLGGRGGVSRTVSRKGRMAMRKAGETLALQGVDAGPSQRVRQAAGDRAEAVADALHELCYRAGVALVRRVNSNLRLVRGGAGPRVVPTKKSTVDCWGILRGGRCVAVEVKSCSDGRLSFDRLPPHQRAELEAVEQLGGLALVLVIVGGVAHAIPWRAIREALAEGRKGLGVREVEVWRCDPRRPYLEGFLDG